MQALRELRESKGMSQHDAARAMDVTDNAISRWERGRSNPLYKYRLKMAECYGVSLDQINAMVAKPYPKRGRKKKVQSA